MGVPLVIRCEVCGFAARLRSASNSGTSCFHRREKGDGLRAVLDRPKRQILVQHPSLRIQACSLGAPACVKKAMWKVRAAPRATPKKEASRIRRWNLLMTIAHDLKIAAARLGRHFTTRSPLLLVTLVLVLGCAHIAQQARPDGLGGTSWQLLKFQGGDDTVLTPDGKTKYTIAFAADGKLSVRFDCNRGRGTWTSPGPNQLQFGPLALTRATCPLGSLHDRIVRQWPFVRSYVIKGGHLFLSLMADGGTYELEPIR
jgi:heat shock protein HslJ